MLTVLPCLDSDEMAADRKRELDIPRHVAAKLGRAAVNAIKQGYYINEDGRKVNWAQHVNAALNAKISIPPSKKLPVLNFPKFSETYVQVTNETTLGAAQRFAKAGLKPIALNFANGIQPGGGFLSGARAQEEYLCRSSALYETLVDDPMYQAHSQRSRPDSTEWAIYSPDVPVFLNNSGRVMEQPWFLSFITCAAPYAPALGQPESGDLLQRRINRVLAIAQAYGYTTLILGAWGCGAFHNDPYQTARDFQQALKTKFDGAFSDIVFAIPDWSSGRRFFAPFCKVFKSNRR